jgi:hypothetical protein
MTDLLPKTYPGQQGGAGFEIALMVHLCNQPQTVERQVRIDQLDML